MANFSPNEVQFITEVKEHIKRDLSDKIRQFPFNLGMWIVQHAVLTGGMSASYFYGETPNDYDFYLKKAEDIDYIKKIIMSTPEFIDLIADIESRYIETMIDGKAVTANAITFKNGFQIITLDSAEMRKAFDFIHCMPYFDMNTSTYTISKAQFNSLRDKKLVLNPNYVITNPIAYGQRVKKYEFRGWKL